jgi:non-hemolytic enterotoxin B/C
MKSVDDIISLTRIAQNPVRPTNLRSGLANSAGSIALLQIYARQALQQPVLDPSLFTDTLGDLLATIARNQAVARRNAASVSETVAPAVIGTITDIMGFGSMMDAFTDAIVPLLDTMPDDPAARTQVLALVAQLEAEAHRCGNEAGAVNTQLSLAMGRLQGNSTALDDDVANAAARIGDDEGALAGIQNEIAEIQRKIGGQIAGVVVSALVMAGGGIVIAVGALATLPANASATDVILTGVGLVVTGATGLATTAALLAADNSRLAALYAESARLSLALTAIRAVSAQVTSLAEATTDMRETAGALLTEWGSIRDGLASLRGQVTRASDTSDVIHLRTALRLAQQDWQAVREQARTLLSRLVDLAPRDVDNILRPAA